jgi:hypothetical protein
MRPDTRPFHLDEALARVPRVQRPALPVRIWHWRHAFLYGGAVPAGLVAFGVAVHPVAAVSLLASVVMALVTTPEMRRWAIGRARCIVTPHRLRSAFRNDRICAVDGRMPTVLWTSRTPDGVRVRVRCPFGMPASSIVDASGLLRVACRADDVVVVREPRSRVVIIGLGYHTGGWW